MRSAAEFLIPAAEGPPPRLLDGFALPLVCRSFFRLLMHRYSVGDIFANIMMALVPAP